MITLKTLPQATAQEVFDQVAEHLLTQNEKSSVGDSCLYRTELEDGTTLKCAAGCLIGDDEYDDAFESNNWRGLIAYGAVSNAHKELIERLQAMHDDHGINTEEWKDKLQVIADQFHLEFKLAEYIPSESTVIAES